MSKKAKTNKGGSNKQMDSGVMTRQDKLMETWANKLSEQFNQKFARFEDALAAMAASSQPDGPKQTQDTRLVNETNKQAKLVHNTIQDNDEVTLINTQTRNRPATFLPPSL